MGPPVVQIVTDETIPAVVDVVIVGGGIIGIATAFNLARRGISVLVCEKGTIAGEQSSRNLGWIRKLMRGPALTQLLQRSDRLWCEMNISTGAESGYRQRPMVLVAKDARQSAVHEHWLRGAGDLGRGARIVSGSHLSSVLPDLRGRFSSALVDPSAGGAEPTYVTSALARAARERGTTIATGCRVLEIERSGGAISGVVTERGAVRCKTVVIAGGVWSRMLCEQLGVEFPQQKILMSIARTSPLAAGPEQLVGVDNILLRPHIGGGYVFTDMHDNTAPIVPDSLLLMGKYIRPYLRNRRFIRLRLDRRFLEEMVSKEKQAALPKNRVLDPPPVRNAGNRAKFGLDAVFPVFSEATVEQVWAGYVDFLPDELPVISPVDNISGLMIVSGFSGLGFGVGPAAGELAADIVSGDTPQVNPGPFKLSRLA